MKNFCAFLGLGSLAVIAIGCALLIHQHLPWPGNIVGYGVLGFVIAAALTNIVDP